MKGYELIDDSKNYFLLKAPNGAKVRVAKNGLSKATSEKIQGYAKGGKVEYGASPSNTLNQEAVDTFKKAFGSPQEKEKPKEGKKIAQYADGGVVEEEEGQKPVDININVGQEQPQREPNGILQSIGNAVSSIAQHPLAKALVTGDTSHLSAPQAQPVAAEGVTPAIGTQGPQNPLQAPLEGAPSQQPGALPVSAQDVQRFQMMPTAAESAAFKEYQKATQDEISAINAGNEELSKIFEEGYGQSSQFVQKIAQHEENYNQISTELKGLQDQVANFQINPKTMFSGGNFLQNIGTALAVLAGGVSQGLTGSRTNPVMDYINNQIDLDIQRQKSEFGKLENQYGILRQRGVHEAEAINLLKAQQYATINAMLRQNELKTKNLTTKAELRKAQAALAVQQAQYTKAAATEQVVRHGVASGKIDPAVYVASYVPKERQKDVYQDLQDIQSYDFAVKQVDELYDKANQLSSAATLNPFGTAAKELKTINSQIASVVMGAFKGSGPFTENDKETLVDPNLPGRFETVAQQNKGRESVKGILARKHAGIVQSLKGYGIPIQQATPVKSLGGYTRVGAKK